MNVPASTQAAAAAFTARFLEARAAYERVRDGLDTVSDIVSRSRVAVQRSRELIDSIRASRSVRSFSTENGCEREFVFSLGARSAERLSGSDRQMIQCVCRELDDISTWEGAYEARIRFDALLQLFALSQDGSTLH